MSHSSNKIYANQTGFVVVANEEYLENDCMIRKKVAYVIYRKSIN